MALQITGGTSIDWGTSNILETEYATYDLPPNITDSTTTLKQVRFSGSTILTPKSGDSVLYEAGVPNITTNLLTEVADSTTATISGSSATKTVNINIGVTLNPNDLLVIVVHTQDGYTPQPANEQLTITALNVDGNPATNDSGLFTQGGIISATTEIFSISGALAPGPNIAVQGTWSYQLSKTGVSPATTHFAVYRLESPSGGLSPWGEIGRINSDFNFASSGTGFSMLPMDIPRGGVIIWGVSRQDETNAITMTGTSSNIVEYEKNNLNGTGNAPIRVTSGYVDSNYVTDRTNYVLNVAYPTPDSDACAAAIVYHV